MQAQILTMDTSGLKGSCVVWLGPHNSNRLFEELIDQNLLKVFDLVFVAQLKAMRQQQAKIPSVESQ